MGMPDTFKVDRLTNEKASHIAIRDSYFVTGYVMTRVVDKETQKCLVDCSAVRWMGGTEFFDMMHPITPGADTLVNRYQLVAGKMTRTVTVNDAFVRSYDYDKLVQANAKLQFKLAMLKTVEAKDTTKDNYLAATRAEGWNACLDAVQKALEFQT